MKRVSSWIVQTGGLNSKAEFVEEPKVWDVIQKTAKIPPPRVATSLTSVQADPLHYRKIRAVPAARILRPRNGQLNFVVRQRSARSASLRIVHCPRG
jgi:hypothetical protein